MFLFPQKDRSNNIKYTNNKHLKPCSNLNGNTILLIDNKLKSNCIN